LAFNFTLLQVIAFPKHERFLDQKTFPLDSFSSKPSSLDASVSILGQPKILQFSLYNDQQNIDSDVTWFLGPLRKYGDVGKKIHTGRSRNDQLLGF